jgi:DNA-binding NarL/FixJ family response regulator
VTEEEEAPTREPITLLICDDHQVLTDALAMVIRRDPTFRMVAAPVVRGEDAVAVVDAERPQVVLMDVELLGEMNGIEATRRIKALAPETQVVVMTAHRDERLMVEAVEAGAAGFLGKSAAADEVLEALKQAAEGEALIDAASLSRVLRLVTHQREARRDADAAIAQLTSREREILQCLAEGMRNADIAVRLFITSQTVQTHVRNILGKLGVHSKLEAVAFAVRHGAVEV